MAKSLVSCFFLTHGVVVVIKCELTAGCKADFTSRC